MLICEFFGIVLDYGLFEVQKNLTII